MFKSLKFFIVNGLIVTSVFGANKEQEFLSREQLTVETGIAVAAGAVAGGILAKDKGAGGQTLAVVTVGAVVGYCFYKWRDRETLDGADRSVEKVVDKLQNDPFVKPRKSESALFRKKYETPQSIAEVCKLQVIKERVEQASKVNERIRAASPLDANSKCDSRKKILEEGMQRLEGRQCSYIANKSTNEDDFNNKVQEHIYGFGGACNIFLTRLRWNFYLK